MRSANGHPPATTGHTIRWWAGFYDALTWALTFGQEPAIRRQTIAVANASPGENVLDVGCGTGTLALAACEQVQPTGRVDAIDASPEMIEVACRKAAKKTSDARFQVAAIETLPFDDGQFDLVLSSLMLHHLPDDVKQAGFAEIHRVLKPGGRLLAVDLTDSSRTFVGRLTKLIGHGMKDGYTDQLKSMIAAAGFQKVVETPTTFKYLTFINAAKEGP